MSDWTRLPQLRAAVEKYEAGATLEDLRSAHHIYELFARQRTRCAFQDMNDLGRHEARFISRALLAAANRRTEVSW